MLQRCFAPAGDLGLDVQLGQAAAHLGDHLREVDLALGRAGAHEVIDLGVALGVQGGERQVLQLLLQLLHAEAVGQRRVDVEWSPARSAAACPRRSAASVRMLWSRSASLMIRTRRSLAIATSILRMVAACCSSLESKRSRSSLVTPSTMAATSLPNSSSRSPRRDLGVLDRVVEEGGGDRGVVEADVGHDAGHRQRMVDVPLARVAELVPVGVGGDLVGAHDLAGGRLRVAGAVAGDERSDLVGRRWRVPPPRQDAVDRAHYASS